MIGTGHIGRRWNVMPCVILTALLPATAGADGPAALHVHPDAVLLDGPRALTQLVVTGRWPDGKERDLTRDAALTVQDPVVRVDPDGLVRPRRDGNTTLLVRAAGKEVRVPVTVRGFADDASVSFRREVIAALNVGGCNAGACHGTPSGKEGFHLSLRGQEPEGDYLRLTRDLFGRRTDPLRPDASLVLLKALGRVPHGGGKRFGEDSLPARTLRAWLRQGRRDDAPGLPPVVRLEVVPARRVLHAPGREQQLAVWAHFADGSARDVTRLTVFSTSDRDVAEVSPAGLVSFQKVGEVAILCRYLQTLQTTRLVYLEPNPDFTWPNSPEHNFVDRHAFAKLKVLGIPPSDLCSDETFLRRAHLDLCARLPDPAEVKAFLADDRPDKRARLVEELLKRPAFADFWTLKWMDVLRGNTSLLGEEGARAYQNWLREHLLRNTPVDRVVRELLTAKGNTFAVGPANYFRAAEDAEGLAEMTAQLFFGVRMQCARCHNHPFEKWTQDDYYSLAAFFARVQVSGERRDKKPQAVEVSLAADGEVRHPRTGEAIPPRFLGGELPELDKGQDRREALAEWVTDPKNPFFARSVVNRVWYHLMGRGIVDPVDDFRDSNPPANDELLDALAKDFVAHGHGLRHLIRTVMASRTYQASSRSTPLNRGDEKYFSHAYPRVLTAEQMLDAICQVTEVPEEFPGFPAGTTAVQLPVGEVSHPFLSVFGKPARELTCECERPGDANLAQALELTNGKKLQEKLAHPNNRLGRLLAAGASDEAILEEVYLATLSRRPDGREKKAALAFVRGVPDRRAAWEDVQWALFSTKEFIFRH